MSPIWPRLLHCNANPAELDVSYGFCIADLEVFDVSYMAWAQPRGIATWMCPMASASQSWRWLMSPMAYMLLLCEPRAVGSVLWLCRAGGG